jgi:hypothetical protein
MEKSSKKTTFTVHGVQRKVCRQTILELLKCLATNVDSHHSFFVLFSEPVSNGGKMEQFRLVDEKEQIINAIGGKLKTIDK